MTIDEAITKYKEITNTDANCPSHCNISCDKCVDESKQLVEWLEELKVYRENSNGYNKEDIELNRNAMYNKAVDDFAILMKETLNHDWASTKISEQIIYNRLFDKCNEIAEQLKAGVRNGAYNKQRNYDKGSYARG